MIEGKNHCITCQGLSVGNSDKNDPLLNFLVSVSLLKVSQSKEEVRSTDVPMSEHRLQKHSPEFGVLPLSHNCHVTAESPVTCVRMTDD